MSANYFPRFISLLHSDRVSCVIIINPNGYELKKMKTILDWTKSLFGITLFRSHSTLKFVPPHCAVDEVQLEKLQMLIDDSSKVLVLTGAGISTESGIPDYRSEAVGLYARSNHRPILHQDFMKSKYARQRYWARNFVGWETFSGVEPNISHLTLSKWERLGKITSLVTQNVDRLHHKAGNKVVIELHGSAYDVKCMNCSHILCRHDFQAKISELNPYLISTVKKVEMRPDADVELPQELINNFRVPECQECRDVAKGFFKPDIVFFGDNVPKSRVDNVFSELVGSDCLLVLGSSLHVYSGYRFILRAAELGIPIAIVNIGPTRGDKHASLKVNARCSEVLSKLCI